MHRIVKYCEGSYFINRKIELPPKHKRVKFVQKKDMCVYNNVRDIE